MWNDKEVCVMNYPVQHDEWCKQAYFINEGLFPIKSTSFVSCYFRRNVVKNVGLPIKEFVIWKDDTEYTERISSRYPSYFVTASKVIHKIKNNVATPIEEDSTDRLWRYKYLYRNISYIMRMKGFKKVLHFYYATLKDIRRILKSDCNGKLKRISIILSGLISGWSLSQRLKSLKIKYRDEKEIGFLCVYAIYIFVYLLNSSMLQLNKLLEYVTVVAAIVLILHFFY